MTPVTAEPPSNQYVYGRDTKEGGIRGSQTRPKNLVERPRNIFNLTPKLDARTALRCYGHVRGFH